MASRSSARQSTALELDSSKCLPFLWTRFSSELTTKAGGQKLYRELILNNYVSFSLVAPCTHRDVIIEIARQSHKTIQIESIPNNLDTLPRGKIVYGFTGDYIDKIAQNYDGMHWWMSDRGLNMGISERTESDILPFDKLAGHLMYEAWVQRLSNGRIPPIKYHKICGSLDEAHFRPLDFLSGKFRKNLAEWNQKHPQKPIHSFYQLYTSRVTLARRGMLTRLNRAMGVWIAHENLSA